VSGQQPTASLLLTLSELRRIDPSTDIRSCRGAECECIAGYTGNSSSCEACPLATYKGNAGSGACTTCGIGGTTSEKGSTDAANCTCMEGYERAQDGAACSACPAGTYKNTTGNRFCHECPDDTDSLVEGATRFDDCGVSRAPTAQPMLPVWTACPCGSSCGVLLLTRVSPWAAEPHDQASRAGPSADGHHRGCSCAWGGGRGVRGGGGRRCSCQRRSWRCGRGGGRGSWRRRGRRRRRGYCWRSRRRSWRGPGADRPGAGHVGDWAHRR
jgi:hypothetical protein